jgi:hypothetical protein
MAYRNRTGTHAQKFFGLNNRKIKSAKTSGIPMMASEFEINLRDAPRYQRAPLWPVIANFRPGARDWPRTMQQALARIEAA